MTTEHITIIVAPLYLTSLMCRLLRLLRGNIFVIRENNATRMSRQSIAVLNVISFLIVIQTIVGFFRVNITIRNDIFFLQSLPVVTVVFFVTIAFNFTGQ
ncbi:hypothetical protein DND47_30190 [Pseudomonas syringae pv. syringae]|nr:hypothetical protein DND47_30190 [Pseudomonas syringae pv. syringae]